MGIQQPESGETTPITLGSFALVAVAYIAVARLALIWALPPGFVTAIWPSAGIAVASVLIFGNRIWPAIFIGSVVSSATVPVQAASNIPLIGWVGVGFMVAVAAVLQALLAGSILRRYMRFPNPLENDRDIGIFIVVAGPLVCLVGALLVPPCLWYVGVVSSGSLAFVTFTWWISETIGVLIGAPLTLIAIGRPAEAWRRRAYSVGLPLTCAGLAVAIVFGAVVGWERERAESAFERHGDHLMFALRREVDNHLAAVGSVANFFDSSEFVDRGEFKRFVGDVLAKREGLDALEWVPRVPDSERDRFAGLARADGHAKFGFTEVGLDGRLQTAQRRPDYYPVFYVEPLEGNQAALGFDLVSSSTRRAALETAARSGQPATSEPIKLVQEAETQHAVLLVVPIYTNGERHDTPAARTAAVQGFAVGVVRAGSLLAAAAEPFSSEGFSVAVFDEAARGEAIAWQGLEAVRPAAVNRSARAGVPWYAQRVQGTSPHPGGKSWQREVIVADRSWTVSFAVPEHEITIYHGWSAWIVPTSGMLLAGLFSGCMLLISGRAVRVERLINERTSELRDANAGLEREVAVRERTEVALDQRARELERSNKELEQFAHIASHDLQEPLRSIAGFTQILSSRYKGRLDEEADKFIDYAVDAAFRMQALIGDLLAYSRVNTRASEGALVDCAAIVRDVLQDLSASIEESGAQVRIDPMPSVWGDSAQISQLFLNLISNAIKYRGDDPLKVRVSATPENAEIWRFCVSDNGIGIESRFLERIFVVFQRLHAIGKYGGTGMGLAVCKKVVERHGGRIWAESQPGKGSRFYFTLSEVARDEVFDDDASHAGDIRPSTRP